MGASESAPKQIVYVDKDGTPIVDIKANEQKMGKPAPVRYYRLDMKIGISAPSFYDDAKVYTGPFTREMKSILQQELFPDFRRIGLRRGADPEIVEMFVYSSPAYVYGFQDPNKAFQYDEYRFKTTQELEWKLPRLMDMTKYSQDRRQLTDLGNGKGKPNGFLKVNLLKWTLLDGKELDRAKQGRARLLANPPYQRWKVVLASPRANLGPEFYLKPGPGSEAFARHLKDNGLVWVNNTDMINNGTSYEAIGGSYSYRFMRTSFIVVPDKKAQQQRSAEEVTKILNLMVMDSSWNDQGIVMESWDIACTPNGDN
jgi:hypothetical protein